MNSDEILQLGREFANVSAEQWRSLSEKALKGKSFEQALLHETYDGITVNPLYTSDELPINGDYPGFFPFVRGFGPIPSQGMGWRSRQRFQHPDPVSANAEILKDLEGGVTSVGLVLDQALRQNIPVSDMSFSDALGNGGMALHGHTDLEQVLASVHLEMVEVSLEAGMGFFPVALSYLVLCDKKGLPKESVQAAFNADPIGAIALGANYSKADIALSGLGQLGVLLNNSYPNATCANVDSSPYHNAGASNAQELGICLATGVSYLKKLVDAGLSVADAFRQIRFSLSMDADIFASAAKMRALRLLWAHIAEASGYAYPNTQIHAITSRRMLTKYDPWVNILRSATAGFASVLGGADCITIEPYDTISEVPSKLGRRIARNTHTILAQESMLTRVADPAGGSWYVESLTQEMADKGWEAFQSIEKHGGIVQAVIDGTVTRSISEVRQRRTEHIARRAEASVGVSEFPNIAESISIPDLAKQDVLRQNLIARLQDEGLSDIHTLDIEQQSALVSDGKLFLTLLSPGAEKVLDPLVPYRDGAAFEKLRKVSDGVLEKTGKRPQIFLANWGTPADFTARSTFAMNLFEAGGIEAINNEGFTDIENLTEALQQTDAKLVVICSSDEQYIANGVSLVEAISQKNVLRTYLAGRPENKDKLLATGVSEFVFAGMDVLEVLKKAHEVLGVK